MNPSIAFKLPKCTSAILASRLLRSITLLRFPEVSEIRSLDIISWHQLTTLKIAHPLPVYALLELLQRCHQLQFCDLSCCSNFTRQRNPHFTSLSDSHRISGQSSVTLPFLSKLQLQGKETFGVLTALRMPNLNDLTVRGNRDGLQGLYNSAHYCPFKLHSIHLEPEGNLPTASFIDFISSQSSLVSIIFNYNAEYQEDDTLGVFITSLPDLRLENLDTVELSGIIPDHYNAVSYFIRGFDPQKLPRLQRIAVEISALETQLSNSKVVDINRTVWFTQQDLQALKKDAAHASIRCDIRISGYEAPPVVRTRFNPDPWISSGAEFDPVVLARSYRKVSLENALDEWDYVLSLGGGVDGMRCVLHFWPVVNV